MSRKMEHLQQRKMVCLTPGVLLKLLDGLNSKVTVSGNHKPTLLQVISIVPALTGSGLWPNQGYFLKVSDSSHSTYVSLSGDDNDLIRRDNLQLGQFIYIDKMVACNPVPLVLGVRAIQGRHPFVGSPKDLMQMVVVSEDGEDDSDSQEEAKVGNGRSGWEGEGEQEDRLKIMVSIKEEKVSVASRYMKICTEGKQKKVGGSDNSAEEEDGRVRKEEELVVANKGKTRKKKTWVTQEVQHNRGTKKRTSKEHREQVVSTSTTTQSEQTSISIRSKGTAGKAPLKTCRKLEDVKAKDDGREEGNPPHKSVKAEKAPSCAVAWKSLPTDVVKLGKEVLKRRNIASFAAALALEEAAGAESLVKCLSMLSSLQTSSAIADTSVTLTKFFDLHHNLTSARKINSPLAALTGKENAGKGKETHKSSCTISIETQQKEKIEWKSGEGGKDMQELRALVLKESESWLLGFLDKVLEPRDQQATITGKTAVTGKLRQRESARLSRVSISEMKSINDWLDGLVARRKEEGPATEQLEATVERLKKKGYEHMLSQCQNFT